MKDDMKILIVGRSGVGKDHLTNRLKQLLGMKQVLSYTTRPKRSPDEDTHIFITPEEAATYTDKVATTVINGYEYFATARQVEECDIYVIDPKGLYELMGNMPDTAFLVVYIDAVREQSKEMAAKRGSDSEKEKEIFEKRRASEDEQFTRFEKEIETMDSGYEYMLIRVTNDYSAHAFTEAINEIVYARTMFRKTLDIVRLAKKYRVTDNTDDRRYVVWYRNEGGMEQRIVGEQIFAAMTMNNNDLFGHIVKELLTGSVDIRLTDAEITEDRIEAAEKVLADNGIEHDETATVLQAIGYTLLDKELYPEEPPLCSG